MNVVVVEEWHVVHGHRQGVEREPELFRRLDEAHPAAPHRQQNVEDLLPVHRPSPEIKLNLNFLLGHYVILGKSQYHA